MRLVINYMDKDAEWIDEWPVPPIPHFMSSQAFAILKRELLGYVRQELAGRSLLIAGHRGSGKTSLVHRAVDEVGRELIEEAMTSSGAIPAHGLQRPIIVKVHGPSLFKVALPPTAEGCAAQQPGAASSAREPWPRSPSPCTGPSRPKLPAPSCPRPGDRARQAGDYSNSPRARARTRHGRLCLGP